MKFAALTLLVFVVSCAFTILCLSISNTAESLAVAWLGSFLIGWFLGKVNK